MRKTSLGFSALVLGFLSLPASAEPQFGVSVRGDYGLTTTQLPYLTVDTLSIPPIVNNSKQTSYSQAKDGEWDWMGRIMWRMGCSPCSPFLAGSWQGSRHNASAKTSTVNNETTRVNIYTAGNPNISLVAFGDDPENAKTIDTSIQLINDFRKAKVGVGFPLLKTRCFDLTMEAGMNYLDTTLQAKKRYDITTNTIGAIDVAGVDVNSGPLPYTFPVFINEREQTQGVGLYASLKGEYSFKNTGLNCFSIYAKAELADIIGRQSYNYDLNFIDKYNDDHDLRAAALSNSFQEHPQARYNNIVEVDLEAAVVFSPQLNCWSCMQLDVALGVRTDSFVNVFTHIKNQNSQSILSLGRATAFLELGIKF